MQVMIYVFLMMIADVVELL